MLLLALLATLPQAHAVPVPAVTSELKTWPEITLRVDLKNLVGTDEQGRMSVEELERVVSETNRVWSACAVRFQARHISNINAAETQVPYLPQSQGDLSLIAARLNPNGFAGEIPLTIAGRWEFYDKYSGTFLHGLGWVFANGPRVDRIGAMISHHMISHPLVGALVGHELGHALSLGHSPEADNMMAGGERITRAQCEQARRFSEMFLREFTAE